MNAFTACDRPRGPPATHGKPSGKREQEIRGMAHEEEEPEEKQASKFRPSSKTAKRR